MGHGTWQETMTALATLGLAVGTIGTLFIIFLQLRRSEIERHAAALPRVHLDFPLWSAIEHQELALASDPAFQLFGNVAPYKVQATFTGGHYVRDVALDLHIETERLAPAPGDRQVLLVLFDGSVDFVETGGSVVARLVRSERLDRFLAGKTPELASYNPITSTEFALEVTISVEFSTDDDRRYHWKQAFFLDGPTEVVAWEEEPALKRIAVHSPRRLLRRGSQLTMGFI
jgi:hypothetical protein